MFNTGTVILAVSILIFLFFKTPARTLEKVHHTENKDTIRTLIEQIRKEENHFPEIQCLEVTATAYPNDPISINVPKWRDGLTSTLMKTDRGVIAVDPKIIPYGSVVYVEGYGYAIALDTGSAIRGHRIDLFFHSREEALKWGVKDVMVCILGRIDYRKARTLAVVSR